MSAAYDHYPEQSASGETRWRREPLPVTGPYPPLFAVLGAHGFAGTTTVAQMWAPAADTGQSWPAHPGTTQLVLVCARANMAGLRRAAAVLRAVDQAPPGVQVCGLILTAARPGKTPKDIARYAGTVAELVPHRYDLDWFEPLMCHADTHRLPQWSPADPPPAKKDVWPQLVPPQIAEVGQQICTDLRTDHHPHTTA
ncbi:hypothetical protein [Williamsia soli]|uniref:hypothetical protein n=1 Tax=Williamsia soli TaxID=364929 RepID=UPI001A9FD97F|nr:hypothetical protein [Williamsia soli]